MTEYGGSHPSGDSPSTTATTPTPRLRKRSKWDQPAPSFMSPGLTTPIVGPPSNGIAPIAGMSPPGMALMPSAQLANVLAASCASVSHMIQVPLVHQNASSLVQKINQNKVQDELIAREIVINDAEPAIRCKLTKRQTQEEIQKITGAVVITRGKYIPPSVQPVSEKPLYLHISAASHLKDMVERIKAVDHAALMVEDIIKQGQCQSLHQVIKPPLSVNSARQGSSALTACLYLGFEPDPSVNIVARIRGPNDQYINHIINETGANVILRGRGSGNVDSDNEDGLQSLHLFLSSNNVKSLESAKLLAENLLDTISMECGASRVSLSKVYGAVPPPQQLLEGVQSTSTVSSAGPATNNPEPTTHPSLVPYTQQPQPDVACQPHFSGLGGTSYNGYGGIYPQATPLQQVALALRQSVPTAAAIPISTSLNSAIASPNLNTTSCPSPQNDAGKKPAPKRKFQELPKASSGPVSQNLPPPSEFVKPGFTVKDSSRRDLSSMPPPKMLVQLGSSGMPPPPPRNMPPPPPKFTAPSKVEDKVPAQKASPDAVSDTLAKLVEYGDDDDDSDEPPVTKWRQQSVPKPFWAV